MTSPAATTSSGAATSSYNFIEQMIQREAQAISSGATASLSLEHLSKSGGPIVTAYPKRSFHAGNAPGKGSAAAAYTPRAMARATTLAATMPEFGETDERIHRLFARRSGEHHVAVERCVHRIDRAGKTGLRDHREPLGLRPGQFGIGHDDRKRGVFHRCRVGSALYAHCQHVRQERRRQSASAIFAADFKWRRPEPRPIADRDAADRIDHRKRGDADAALASSPMPSQDRP